MRDGNCFARGDERYVPLIEAKMLHHFDHRFGTYEGQTEAQGNQGKLPEFSDAEHANPERLSVPKYWVPGAEVRERLAGVWERGWLIGWRDICRSTDQRTVIASIIPRAAVGDKFPLLLSRRAPQEVGALYANLCSFALDYCARQKVGGISLKYFTIKQLPVLPPVVYAAPAGWAPHDVVRDWVLRRVLELTYAAWDLEAFAKDVGYDGPPFRWDPARRFLLRAELDAAFFHLYSISRDDADYILETFPVVKKNDEKEHKEYRTKRVILEIYDAMAEAIRTGKPYQTRLDPPPADSRVAHRPPNTKLRAPPAKIERLPDAVWERPQPFRPADAGVVIAAVLKAIGGPAPATRVRLAALLALEPRLVSSPDRKELAEWKRLVGSDANPLPRNVAALIPRADLGWGAAVKLLRGNGLLVEDVNSNTWSPGKGLDAVPTDGWAGGRAGWVVELLARRGDAEISQALPAGVRELVDGAAA